MSVAPTPPPSATSATPGLESSSFLPAVSNLADTGIYLQLGYTEDIFCGVAGGDKNGVATIGELVFGTVSYRL